MMRLKKCTVCFCAPGLQPVGGVGLNDVAAGADVVFATDAFRPVFGFSFEMTDASQAKPEYTRDDDRRYHFAVPSTGDGGLCHVDGDDA